MPLSTVRVSASDTSKVPNASPTAASSGSDLNGMAARDAARTLRERLVAFAARKFDCDPKIVVFARRRSCARASNAIAVRRAARTPRTSRACQLSATGFYATPKIHYDRKTLTGRPFFYFAYGAAVSEVAIDTLTGEHRLLRGGHPARRRRVAQSGDRSRPDRRRLHPGLGLADDGGAVVERATARSRRTRRRRTRFPTARDMPRAFPRRLLRRAQPRGDDPSLQGRRRAAVDAGAVRLPRAARRDRQRRRLRRSRRRCRCAGDAASASCGVDALRARATRSAAASVGACRRDAK